MTTINISEIFTGGQAKLLDYPKYEKKIKELAPAGEDIVLTGAAPIWLYLKLAHALHGIARSLTYDSPVTGKVVIFDHNPL